MLRANFVKLLLPKVNTVAFMQPARLMSDEVQNVEKSINQVTLLGRVGADPQQKGSTENPVTTFTLATQTTRRVEDEVRQKTEWHNITVFRPNLRDIALKYLRKGNRVHVTGRIIYGNFVDKNGIEHQSTTIAADDIIMFGGAPRQ